jgi:hypothetical protein
MRFAKPCLCSRHRRSQGPGHSSRMPHADSPPQPPLRHRAWEKSGRRSCASPSRALPQTHKHRHSGLDIQPKCQLTEGAWLRDLLSLTDRGIPDYGAATARLAMLPRDFLPFWRRWAELRFALISSAQLDSDMDNMGAPADLRIQDRYVWALREDVRRTVARKGHPTRRGCGRGARPARRRTAKPVRGRLWRPTASARRGVPDIAS